MNHQKHSIPNGSSTDSQGGNKRKRKRKFSQVSDSNMNSITSSQNNKLETAGGDEESSQVIQSAKRRRRNRKKKKPADSSSSDAVRPVLVVKNPEDYSANWKKLKEIIAKEEKKPSSSSRPVRRDKGKDQNFKRQRYKNNHGKDSLIKKAEGKESEKKEDEDLEIWFDNVDPILLEESARPKQKNARSVIKNGKSSADSLVKEDSTDGATKVIAMDCEMVGVGMDGKDSIVARVSIVNQYGKVLYDKYVKPTEEVVDYRTAVSGIRPEDIRDGCEFAVVQKEVSDLIEGRILVGHSVHNDLRILFLTHPRADIRDTAKYKAFVRLFGGRTPSLKKLVERLLGVQIQQGEHNSVQDAQAAMRVYTMHRKEWEKSRNKYRKKLLNKTANQGKSKPQSSETPSKAD